MSHDLLKELQKPFVPEDIEWRIQSWGKKSNGEYWAQVLAYVTNRAIMNRLDDVVGPHRWKNEFKEWHNGSQLCGISIACLLGDDVSSVNWVTKWDGAECTHIEAIKGGLSDAMKRAAVQWGIGRYLYELETDFAQQISIKKQERADGWKFQKADGKENFYWLPPNLPEWALPEGHTPPPKNTGLKKPQIPAKPAEDAKVAFLRRDLDGSTTAADARVVFSKYPKEVRNLIDGEFIDKLKERLGI